MEHNKVHGRSFAGMKAAFESRCRGEKTSSLAHWNSAAGGHRIRGLCDDSRQQEPLIVGVNNLDMDPNDESVLPHELSEQVFRQSTVSGSHWQVLSSIRLSWHEAYTYRRWRT